jgi:DNA-binding MarR family transcriptional regulator
MHTYSPAMIKETWLDACNCFATRQAARHITRLYERHLSAANITSAQFSILVALGQKKRMTMSELAALLVMDRTTLLRAVKPLVRDGLLVSRPGASDSRQLVLLLSAPGKRKLKQALRLWRTAQSEFESRVGAARASRMRRDLLTLARQD